MRTAGGQGRIHENLRRGREIFAKCDKISGIVPQENVREKKSEYFSFLELGDHPLVHQPC